MANIFFDIGHNNNMARADRDKLIFLEGTDDALFFDHLLTGMNADPEQVGLVTVGGKGEFIAKIKGFKKTPKFTQRKTKGILAIRDADDDFHVAEKEMTALFNSTFGINLKHGEIQEKDGILYGFFLLPGTNRSGDLEELCLDTVTGKALEEQSAAFLSATEVTPQDQFYKRKAQVYLAGFTGDLCRGAGLGFKKGKFDDQHETLQPIKDFISAFSQEKSETA